MVSGVKQSCLLRNALDSVKTKLLNKAAPKSRILRKHKFIAHSLFTSAVNNVDWKKALVHAVS